MMEKFDDVCSGIERITPEIAAEMLLNNHANRGLSRVTAGSYARDMAAGRWRFTGDPIRFAGDGTLIDGQHRLTAVVQSGTTLMMMVIRGLDLRVRDAIDGGRTRTTADRVKLLGNQSSTVLAAAARLILTDGDQLTMRPSNSELLEVIETDPHLKWVVSTGTLNLGTIRRSLMTPGLLAYSYWRLHRLDVFATAEFYGRLESLENLASGSPILALQRRLTALRGDRRGRENNREVLAVTFQGWNKWRKGETSSLIRATRLDGKVFIPDPI